jgi:hypothetical protein
VPLVNKFCPVTTKRDYILHSKEEGGEPRNVRRKPIIKLFVYFTHVVRNGKHSHTCSHMFTITVYQG